jgi:hypothetical protein
MAKKAKQTIVGSPLTPELLAELGAIARLPVAGQAFEPGGEWENTYRIWTCHGYRESGNANVGFLRIRRTADSDGRAFRLTVQQTVIEGDGMVSSLKAELTCSNDQLAAPVSWELASRFFGPEGEELTALDTRETASVEGGTLLIRTPAAAFKRSVPVPLSCDWSLFDAVQRLKFDTELPPVKFTMLEGLSVLKVGQYLSCQGERRAKFGPEAVPLHGFQQLGQGVLPTEYWLGSDHRLLIVTSMNKALILDEEAEKMLKEKVQQSHKRSRQTRPSQPKESP